MRHRSPQSKITIGLMLASAFVGFTVIAVNAYQLSPPLTITPSANSSHAAPGVRFTDVTETAGLGHLQHTSGTQSEYIIEAGGSGVTWLDYDNDGWQDIYWVNGGTMEVLKGKSAAPLAMAQVGNLRHRHKPRASENNYSGGVHGAVSE